MLSQAELFLRVITLWFLVLSQFFRDGMGITLPVAVSYNKFHDVGNETGCSYWTGAYEGDYRL